MTHSDVGRSVLRLAQSCRKLDLSDPLTQCLAPRLSRSFATPTQLPNFRVGPQPGQFLPKTEKSTPAPSGNHDPRLMTPPRVLTTIHSWPSLEPKRFSWYDAEYLDMPLRRDLLHRAVIYEGDASRRGTASTKHRSEVHGSNKKVIAQKGTGKARAGDRMSPIRRGGGVAHGPKPRDFSTELQRKVYDKAWRTALSYRYRKDELMIVENNITLPQGAGAHFMDNFFHAWQYGKGHGRSLFVVDSVKEKFGGTMKQLGQHGLVKDVEDVDVKDLLELGRIFIERKALDSLLMAHSSDIASEVSLEWARRQVRTGRSIEASKYAQVLNLPAP